MSKKMILGLTLAIVLVAVLFFSAQADCGFCLPHISLPSCLGFCGTVADNRDRDRAEATCQGAYNWGPKTPDLMGSVAGAY